MELISGRESELPVEPPVLQALVLVRAPQQVLVAITSGVGLADGVSAWATVGPVATGVASGPRGELLERQWVQPQLNGQDGTANKNRQ